MSRRAFPLLILCALLPRSAALPMNSVLVRVPLAVVRHWRPASDGETLVIAEEFRKLPVRRSSNVVQRGVDSHGRLILSTRRDANTLHADDRTPFA